ncbi:sigma-70 family RNA polymerase sigma factor [Mesorhizobium sp. M1D.F.Ca.ET.184.01.1.1]|nr:sigma-70 family RNA polymerase sigma factor [Mesorhizobium sp. M1D.F.Ca.ET.231.01.1.1]TGP30506.1 sigma-70 family RNA polymerase sigma factor [Mesorhizobium sp. M1D.F.Ca.ET.234.01.1.1]TGS44582.1 sigma-70 family RNA polymerase sigma factor [Mesorhizobium sp. M1D.F.Ca.ET.184.01.1.1]TGS60622.1 sigma-70 family RNA polymerase sigma factor [Mesorhizobium sp. M1D.F.Ca.ET.183.01.1.1]
MAFGRRHRRLPQRCPLRRVYEGDRGAWSRRERDGAYGLRSRSRCGKVGGRVTGLQDHAAATTEVRLRIFEREAAGSRARLHRYCSRMVGSVIDGEDIVQEALAKAFVAIRNGDMPDKTEPWLFRIAHNSALDFLRKRSRAKAHESDVEPDTIADEDCPIDARIAAEASLAGLMQLPPAQRCAVVLKDVLGHSLEEIGEILETTETAIKGALQRGRESLRKLAAVPAAATPRPALDQRDMRRLGDYVAAFNARDFDVLRGLLADDVKLELVNRLRAEGKEYVGNYFGRYADETHWHFTTGLVEGRPAILVTSPDRPDGPPRYFILIDWQHGRIAGIRDFLFADYVMDGLEFSSQPSGKVDP